MPDLDLKEVIASAIETLISFSVPLYLNRDEKPYLIGSGFFLATSCQCFLVTAAHVLDEADQSEMYYYTSTRMQRVLRGKRVRSKTPAQRKQDQIDIGILNLGENGLPPYPEVNKFALKESYLQPSYLPRRRKEYVIIGFPASKNRFGHVQQQIIAAPYAYRADSIPDEEYSRYDVSPETHVVLPLDLRKGFDADGNPITFPKPQGMSGAPVIVLFGDESSGERVFPVVAVGIEYRKTEKVLVATDVRFVLEGIRNAA